MRNAYGQSETVSCVVYFKINHPYELTPIGKAVNSTISLHVLNEDGKEMPIGETGELCVEGDFGVTYLNDPEKSVKTFIKLENGKTLIHTGDIVYKNEDGDIVYVLSLFVIEKNCIDVV